MSNNGCVIFAKNIDEVAKFYQAVFNLTELSADNSHKVLGNNSLELLIHAIPKEIADNINIESPPAIRENTAMKPVYIVDSLDAVRIACKGTSGGLKPDSQAFEFRNMKVLDGWDPEGNVFQVKQVAT